MVSSDAARQRSTPPPKGVYVPVPTFFASSTDNHSACKSVLDLETQSKHTRFLADGGVKGLVLLGSTGEAIVTTAHERYVLIKSQRQCLDSHGYQDRPIIAGTVEQHPDAVLESIRISKDAGAAFAMVLAPGYFAPVASQHGIQQWFEAIADSSSLPIMIYHYPGVTNNLYIAPETFVRLAAHPNIVGTKLSHGVMDDQTLITTSNMIDHDYFHTFTGLGQTLLPFLSIGGAGTIDGLAGCFPRTVVRLFELHNAKQEASGAKHHLTTTKDGSSTVRSMQELQGKICEGEKLVARWGVIGIKEALSRVWNLGDRNSARLPLSGGFPDGDREWEKWQDVFSKLQTLEESL